MSRVVRFGVLTLSLVVILYVALGYVLGQTVDNRAYRALAVYIEVLQRIQQDYVEEPNLSLVTSGALHGLLESLDPRSSYLSPHEYAEYKKQLRNNVSGGIGAVLSKRFGYIVVVSVLHDGPAYKAGLRSGDIFEGVAGFTTREMSIGQAEVLLRGEPGTPVKVSVVSRRLAAAGQAEEVEIIRSEIAYPPVGADALEGNVGYLRVPALHAGQAAEIRQKVMQLEKQGADKLVVDLRECAVGEVNEAIEAARLFVPSGTLATLRGQTVAEQKFSSDPSKIVWKHPLSVLISNGTSGAAEILAAALADHPTAAGTKVSVVGERTFGTASEQKLIPLEDGAALVLTVASYYTPSGKSIPQNGVEPTVEVATSRDLADLDETELDEGQVRDTTAGDAALKKAIELLLAPDRSARKGQARLAPRRNLDLASE